MKVVLPLRERTLISRSETTTLALLPLSPVYPTLAQQHK
jgi:hypothetical protein